MTTTSVLLILAAIGVVAFIVHERIFGPKGEGIIDQIIKLRMEIWRNNKRG